MNHLTLKTKDIKRAYISGKISGIDFIEACRNFSNAEKELIRSNQVDFVVNPINIEPFLGRKSWICYMINDIRAQRKCTHSAFQPNWKDSRGAVIEYYFAKFVFKQEIIFL